MSRLPRLPVIAGVLLLVGCDAATHTTNPVEPRAGGVSIEMPNDVIVASPERNAQRKAYFGDLHVHTAYSFDAFAFGTIGSPEDAYRFAKGAPLQHPGGFKMQLKEPLDFYAVTDHAMLIGSMKAGADPTTEFSRFDHVKPLHNMNAPENLNEESIPQRFAAFGGFLGATITGVVAGEIPVEMVNNIARDAWADIIRAAEVHNDPGNFTTFVAYEYTTSSDDRGNLHRNVIFRGADKLPAMPFSRFHSQDPEGLWDWMDGLRDQGIESLAIPHNANGSNGQMFKLTEWAGDPMDENYTAKRIRNEPLIEITQVKGTSETHPLLSPNDEWADFEIMPFRVGTTLHSQETGSYAREALLNGLQFQAKDQTNPYKFGFVAASDSHTASTSVDEDDFSMKVGLLDATPARRGSVPFTDTAEEEARVTMAEQAEDEGIRPQFKKVEGKIYSDGGGLITFGAAGLAAVWAEENTRDAIYNAFRRKETFATSGPRLKVRMFAGYGLDDAMLTAPDLVARAYRDGVAMGSDLLAEDSGEPAFLAMAVRDARSAPLQRLQIVKGWLENGTPREQVYDVACAEGNVDPATHRCPDSAATVNLDDCSISADIGASELQAIWRDPGYDASIDAFYYVRVLENPTCRWSTWDALRNGTPPRPGVAATIQERAWTSPIWLIPEGE